MPRPSHAARGFLGPLIGPLIGVVHMLPLPGSPGYGGSIRKVAARAVSDAKSYAKGGADALIIENFGDAPFLKGALPAEVVAAFAICAQAVKDAVELPLGINALRNDARSALGVACAVDAQFVRVNVLAGVVATDQGIIEGCAAELLRLRAALGLDTRIAADVHVKHGRTLHADAVGPAAKDLIARAGADAVIVTGAATGSAAAIEEVEAVRGAIGNAPLLVGSGVTEANAADMLAVADGLIVGTSLKRGGRTIAAVDPKRVERLARIVHA